MSNETERTTGAETTIQDNSAQNSGADTAKQQRRPSTSGTRKTSDPLGRGLSAKGLSGIFDSIAPPDTGTAVPEGNTQEVDIDLIDNDPTQPRSIFDETLLDQLAQSIECHGLIQPLVVTKVDDRYRIIAGERRYRAARQIGLKRVPVIVRDVQPAETLELALVENLQRADLNPMEQSRALHRLMADHGLTQQEIAVRMGKSRSAIANIMRLTSLPTDVTEMISEGLLSLGHAKVLLGLDDPDTITEVAKEVVQNGLSVRETEELARTKSGFQPEPAQPEGSEKKSPRQARRSPFAEAQAQLTEALGTKVRIAGSESKGRITIEYASKDQLEDFFERLKSLQQHEEE